MSPISRRFVGKIETFAQRHQVPLIRLEKGERKEELAWRHRAASSEPEGACLIGKAQEKARVFRTERRCDEQGEGSEEEGREEDLAQDPISYLRPGAGVTETGPELG